MQQEQQKQLKSDDQFESLPVEVETVDHPTIYHAPDVPKTCHPRNKQLAQKQKLGLVISPNLVETQYSLTTTKQGLPSQGKVINIGSFTFKSNFQSGSIGSVDLIGNNSFKISLDLQSNSSRGNSWFYFTVEGVKGEAQFLIKGFSKRSSLFNEGMKICYRDSKESSKWRRGGSRISYESYAENQEQERNYCLKFTYFFKTSEYSSVQFAYSFPYTSQKLNLLLTQLHPKLKTGSLGYTYEGRSIPLVTIGNPSSKDLIVISGRVHPGQTGSSLIAEGLLKELTSDLPFAQYLRDRFLFKIIPMINVDGVCKGNYRFSASGVDLNRKWKQPSQVHHPEIYLLKEMIKKESAERRIRMFIDLHGHSRKKNAFFYGCSQGTQDAEDCTKAKAFPYLMSKIHNAFNYQDCSFNIQKDKEGTARVTLFKELKIHEIFTLQTSFCGPSGGANFSELDYEKIGRKLCEGISVYFYEPSANTPNISAKLLALKESSMKELTNSAYLLSVGNQEDSGSDSEPEKGEILEKPVKSTTAKPENNRKKTVNASSAYNRTMTKISSSLKQKSEASLIQEQKQQKERDLYMYLLDARTQIIEADFKNKQAVYNQRVHSFSRQAISKPKPMKKTSRQKNSFLSLNPNHNRKIEQPPKVNLMVGREGAQYRRVRKMAEQSLRQNDTEPTMLQVKCIRGSKIEVDSRHNLRSGLQDRTKFRKTSAQMFFRKPMRMEQKTQLGRNEINVLCRGKQIIF